jgi:hypothetical protein
MAKSKGIILPNTHKLWVKGFSLGVYSGSFDSFTQKQDFSELGQAVYEYKYFRSLPDSRRQELVRFFSSRIIQTLRLEEDAERPNFNSCIGVMPNRNTDSSLPLELALQLSIKFDWLRDDSNCLIKTKELPVMKNIADHDVRISELKGGYKVLPGYDFKGVKGFLIIDDIFETGSTLRELCRTLNHVVPNIPRYVLTLTHLRSVWSAPR